MASPEVDVHEIKGLLRLRGEGLRSIERLSGLDRKTVRREVTAAQACGAVRGGGEGSRVRATCDTQHVGVMV
jgi:hypothetical protein